MGNNVVIPSFGNWYVETLRRMKIRVKSTIESSTFFITFDCVNENDQPLIVKAYQYNKSLRTFPIVLYSEEYFIKLHQYEDFSICGFDPIKIIDKCAYLVRPKFEYTLSQRLTDYPLPEEIEKKWISYELVAALKTFHEAGLIHGNLHPDNVFLSWDLRLTIGDPAPYKPAQIQFNHPQTFIHFFGSSNTHCYLSPRRLIINGDEEKLKDFSDLDESDDIFAVGCIVYFIFTQKHLFTLSTIRDYVEGRYNNEIDRCLNEVPAEMRELIRKCIDLDPKQRVAAFDTINTYFPLYFSQFFSQIQEFFANHITLSNLVKMIPILEEFAIIGGDDVRIIWTNILAQFLLKSNDLHSKVNFCFFFVNFFAPLSDEMVLTRVFPNLIGLLSTESTLLTTTVFDCIETLFNNIKAVPPYLKLIFRNYLVPTLSDLLLKSPVNIQCSIWAFIPRLLRIACRLDPESVPSFIKIFSLIFQTTDKIVLDSFVNSFELLLCEENFSFHEVYSQLLSCLNSPSHLLRIYVIDIFRKYHDHVPIEGKNEYRKVVNNILPVAFAIGDGEYASFILDFLEWIVNRRVIDKYYYSDVFNFIIPFFNSTDSTIRYSVGQILKKMPEEYSIANLPRFVLNSLNKREVLSTKLIHQSSSILPIENPLNLIDHSKINAKSKFLSSARVSTFPITSIMPLFNYEGYKAIASDSTGNLYKFSNTIDEYEPICSHENKINSAITLNSANLSLIAEPNRILLADWDPLKFTSLSYNIESPILTINKVFNDHCFYTTHEDSSVTFYDKRSTQPVTHFKFNDNTLISTCIWPKSQTVAFGFDEGFVTLYDTRVFLPIQTYTTVQAETISPLFDENGSFFVGGFRGSQVFNFTNEKPIVKFPIQTQYSIPYKGSAVFFSQDATYLVKLHASIRAFALTDQGVVQLAVKDDEKKLKRKRKKKNDSLCVDENGDDDDKKVSEEKLLEKKSCITFSDYFEAKPPLHNHSVPITTVTELEYGFASGDMNGNVNFWKIE